MMKRVVCSSIFAAVICAPSLAGLPNPVPPDGSGGWANQHLGHWRPEQPDFGFEFATITHAGNRAANASERAFPGDPRFPNLGSVGYEYRISTTEVTAQQWMPFLTSYTRHHVAAGGEFTEQLLSSESISIDPQSGAASIRAGEGRSGVRTAWMYAARYCNWLHNGAPTGPDVPLEVFQTGAYDMPALSGPTSVDFPLAHNADARYWIPTIDEWVKAAHYDPNRYGEGEEGYWLSMGGQVDPLTPGLPWEGGETSAGPSEAFGFTNLDAIPVAAYEDVVSPWGLYDTSGQEREWTETAATIQGEIDPDARFVLGSASTEPDAILDAIDGALVFFPSGVTAGLSPGGFRIASAIPSPSAGAVFVLGALLAARRRR